MTINDSCKIIKYYRIDFLSFKIKLQRKNYIYIKTSSFKKIYYKINYKNILTNINIFTIMNTILINIKEY